jgi:hypothetical protein
MATAYLKNSIKSGPDYQVVLRDVEDPDQWKMKRTLPPLAVLKLDFRPPKDIKDYMDIPPESSSGISQMYLELDEMDMGDILGYAFSHGLLDREIIQYHIKDWKDHFEKVEKAKT